MQDLTLENLPYTRMNVVKRSAGGLKINCIRIYRLGTQYTLFFV